MDKRPVLLVLPLLALAGCGGADAVTRVAAPRTEAAETRPEPRVVAEPEPMHTAGLTGSLSTGEVHETLEPRAEEFGRCFAEHGGRLRTLGGRMELAFHVDREGHVTTVHGVDSTIGHRAVERCILEVAHSTRFPRPHGGEADFSWPLELDPPPGVRHPVTWDPGRIVPVVRRRARRVIRRCLPEGSQASLQVTTYVSRSGRVLSAGAIAREPGLDDRLDCVARLVRRWRMPPHARHQAKVTFELR